MKRERRAITEDIIVKQVKEVIALSGLAIQRINTGCFTVGEGTHRRYIRTAQKGTLDFEGYDNHGRHVGIECKRPEGGRLTPEQEARINDINRKGGVAFVAKSGDEALKKLFDAGCI